MNLTGNPSTIILSPPISRLAGSRNPFSIGEKSPQSIAAFLCLSFSMASCRVYFVMTGCLGQRSALAGSNTRFSTPFQSVAHEVESIGGGIQPQYWSNRMNSQATGEIRPAITKHPEAVNDFFQQMLDLDAERQAVTEAGIPALNRLAAIAERDTG